MQTLDYFPTRGDAVYWRGYRYEILNAVIPPEAYWQQTGVWLGMSVECIVPPEGDARPIPGLDKPVPAEISTAPRNGPSRVPAGPLPVEHPLPQNWMLPERPV